MPGKKDKLDLIELRKGGILKQRQKDFFLLRTRIPGGYLQADTLGKFRQIAQKYGRGYVHLSTRQAIEIPWIHFKDIERLKKELKKAGILLGACGPRARNIVACSGATICRFSFTDTQKLAQKFDQKFFGQDVPKKFKISLSGCPNSCAKAQENDLGFMGVAEPKCDLDKCIKCTLCADVCQKVCARAGRPAAIIMDGHKRPIYRRKFCFFEGDCVRVCPVNAWQIKRTGYTVFLGGKVGRFPMLGYKIAEFVSGQEIFRITEKTITYYNKIAEKDQRLGEAINKIDIEEVKKAILCRK